jgi:hypothetical protein
MSIPQVAGANGVDVGLNPVDAMPLKGAEGMYGDGEATLEGVSGLEGPATDSRSIAGSDIVMESFQTEAEG